MIREDDSIDNIISQVNTWLEEFCHEQGHIYLTSAFDSLEATGQQNFLNTDYTCDGVHLNLHGYEVLGKAMAKALTGIVESDATLLLLGDSITAGFPDHDPDGFFSCVHGDPMHTFAYWLEESLQCRTINRGICGDTTTGMAKRLGEYLKTDPMPDFVVIQGGANDCSMLCFGKTSAFITEKIKINYRYIHELCSWQKVRLIYVPMLPMNW